jgi:hypothetical protein
MNGEEFEAVEGGSFHLAGASASIELRSPYFRDLLDETPRNTVKASVVAAATVHASSSTSNMLPDANAWDQWS